MDKLYPGYHESAFDYRSDTFKFMIEKVHLDDLDLYVITFAVLATSV